MIEFTVTPPHAGERLDRFLAGAQPDLSRSRLQALIRDGLVRVNGRPARVSHRLADGDRVVLEPPVPRASALEPEDLPLTIVHEDAEILVIDKPAGLVVHPGAGVRTGTLVHALLHHDPALASVGGAGRPGIVHRLDRDTSGLMVVARTGRAFRALTEAIKARRVERRYRALVWGDVRGDTGSVDQPVGRDPHHRTRMAVTTRGGRPSRTHWRVVERFGIATELELTLETGRTHQIRVHMAHLRHPVVGDPVYGGRVKKMLSLSDAQRSLAAALLRTLPRQALHASELRLSHPLSGESLHFRSPLPEDLATARAQLAAASGPRRT